MQVKHRCLDNLAHLHSSGSIDSRFVMGHDLETMKPKQTKKALKEIVQN